MAQTPARNDTQRGNHQLYARMTHPNPQRHVVPTAVLTRSKLVPLIVTRPVTTAVPQPHMTRPRPAKTVVTKPHLPPRRNITGNPHHALKDKGVIDSGCSRHMIGNMSYLFDFEEINGGYVALGGNPKGEKISDTECIVLSLEFKLPDENKVLLRVPRENNMYNVDLNYIVLSGGLTSGGFTCLSAKAEAVNTPCYVQNMVLVTKPHNKTLYELLLSRTPSIGFMRPFGCPVTILNTLDPLGKFDGKVDEGFLVGYFVSSKAFRVFNSITQIIQETLLINFLENKPNVAGSGLTWLFDIDTLTKSMNYQTVTACKQSNPSTGVQEQFDAEKAEEDNVQQYVLFPLWSFGSKDPQNTNGDATFGVKEHEFKVEKPKSEVNVSPSSSAQTKKNDEKTKREAKGKSPVDTSVPAIGKISTNNTNTFSAAGPSNIVVSPTHVKSSYMDPSQYPDDPNMPALEDITYS
nr:retrovirus-related Pol polyprotein from transposon TNT 1-94 [Tanacetum cinerariifolium]